MLQLLEEIVIFIYSLSLPGQSCPKDWDFAAQKAILKAAGGTLTNIDNEDLIYNQKILNKVE